MASNASVLVRCEWFEDSLTLYSAVAACTRQIDDRLVDSSLALKPDYLHTKFAVLVHSDGPTGLHFGTVLPQSLKRPFGWTLESRLPRTSR